MRNSRGFTLIEVLMTVLIMATLSVLAARSIQQGLKAKEKIQGQIDDVSKIRDALRLMERDLNLAYHHRDFELELQNLIKKKSQPATQPGVTPPPAQPEPIPEAPRKSPETHFDGTENEMHFVTMNNTRMIRNSRQADFVEVGYSLKDCASLSGEGSSRCLWRRSSPVVDDDVKTGGQDVVLLENVREFSLQYIGKGKDDWVKDWKTGEGGDAVTRGRFPQAVQISLTVTKGEGDAQKKYSMQIVASIHFPNNKEEDGNAAAAAPNP